jgi:lipoate-protein ligase A
MPSPHCRLLPFHAALGAWNMAADEVLLEEAVAGRASFRLYAWSQPTLSLGYFQRHEECRADPRLRELAWVRRPTGGEALVHHHEVTYALCLPAGAPWQRHGQSWLRRMHELLAAALRSRGVAVHVCGTDEEKKRGKILCFLHDTPGDLRIGAAKIAGSAQRKRRGALLQHGSVLLAGSPFTPHLPGIRELIGLSLERDALCAAVIEQLANGTGWVLEPSAWSLDELRRIDELAADKYAHPAWNGKR